jgi:ABC-type lipoprotein export system ATPase subunit
MKTIRLDNVSKYYQSQDQVSVGMKHVSLSFEIGEFVAITGESGSGKSTLLNVISGLDKYEDGEMYVFGEETSHFLMKDFENYRSLNIGFVFQNYNIIDSYTVYQNVMLALELQGFPKSERKKRAIKLIEQVDLKKQTHQKASKLSGGQKQRAVIARALAKDTPILVCDEPTGNLDQTSAKAIMSLLHDISKDKLIIVVTHEYNQVEPFATRRIKMSDGEVVEDTNLKPFETKEVIMPSKQKSNQLSNLLTFAFRSLFAQPKRFLFMLLLLTLVISVFTVVYSNQVFGVRTTGLEQSQVFPSVPNTRVLVERRDGKALTLDDIDIISSKQGVEAIYTYGALFFNNSRIIVSQASQNDFFGQTYYIEFIDSALNLTQSDLVVGRLPQSKNEVVLNIPSNFGTMDVNNLDYHIFLQDYFNWGDRDVINEPILTVKIVGYTSNGNRNTLFFSEEYLNQPYPSEPVVDYQLKSMTLSNIRGNLSFVYNNQNYFAGMAYKESEGEVSLHEPGSPSLETKNVSITFEARSITNTRIQVTKNVEISINENFSFEYAYISKDLYNEIISELSALVTNDYIRLPSTIASVSVSNQLSGQRLTETLDIETYKVFYPSNISSSFQSFFIFLLTIFSAIILTVLGLFLYAIIHAVTKNMMQSRTKDFAIYRSVGAHEQTLSFLVITEQMLLSGLGLLISVLILNAVVMFVPNHGLTIEYMSILDYIILTSFILIFSIWLGLRFNKRVFKQTVIQSLTNGGSAS